MKEWSKKIKWPSFQMNKEATLTVKDDPYGYAIPANPSFFPRRLFERLIRYTTIPDDQQSLLDDLSQRGTVVYALKYRSQLDFMYLNRRLYQLGLPTPSFTFDFHPYAWQPAWYAIKLFFYRLYHYFRKDRSFDPYEGGYYRNKIEKGEAGLLSLLGKRGYYKRAVRAGRDPLGDLIEIQKDCQHPIFIVPVMLLYTRDPGRERRGPFETLKQREQLGYLRKLFSFLRSYRSAALEVSEPLNLQDVLPEISEKPHERRQQVFQLRRALTESADKIKRGIVGPMLKTKLELKEIILNHPRLETTMQRRARATDQKIWKIRMEADGYLDEIAADYSMTLIQIGDRVLSWMWNNLFDGVEVDTINLQKVKWAARNQTLVYIPCHKSHIDYLILSYILFRNNLYTPFIAAGANLSFWPLGPIFRRCGAFFIRRTFKGARFYTEVFSLYIKTMVQLGYNIEFFIEGGRSRTGKMILPKMGLLVILIQAVEEGFCDDLAFVPTSICYDRIPEEEAYLQEITGGTKASENIGQLFRARRFLKRRYGKVYVKFAEPMSLQRYLKRYYTSFHELPPKQKHAVYRDMAYRIINNINQISLVTPHALVASALMTTSSYGITMAEFQEICKIFYDYLVLRDVGLSNTFNHYDLAIGNALRDLERNKFIGKLKDEDDALEEEVFTLEGTKRITLEYYKNNIIHFFLPLAFVSTSILAQQSFHFDLSQIFEDSAFITHFFKYEFVYDNDISNEKMVRDVLEVFERMNWLNRAEEDDSSYVLTHEGLKVAQAFHGLLRNYFEGYWLVLRAFRYLQKKPYAEKEFTKKILSLGEKALKLKLIERPESISKIMFSNALKYYVEKGVIDKKMDKEKDQELYSDTGDRELIHYYSKQISYFLRSPRFTLQ
jgi:glycerol-3-phosphate O-acyltransferase